MKKVTKVLLTTFAGVGVIGTSIGLGVGLGNRANSQPKEENYLLDSLVEKPLSNKENKQPSKNELEVYKNQLNNDLKSLKTQQDELLKTLSKLDEKADKKELLRLSKELDAISKRIGIESSINTNTLASLDTKGNELKEVLIEKSNEINNLIENKSVVLKNAIANVETTLSNISKKETAINELLDTSKNEINTKLEELKTLETNLKTKINEVSTKIDTVDQDTINRLNTEIQDFNSKKNEIITKIQEYNEIKSNIDSTNTEINNKVNAIDTKIEEFKSTTTTKLQELDTKIQEFNNKKSESDTKIDGISVKIDGIDAKISDVNTKIEATKTLINESNQTINTKLQELETLKQNIENKINEVSTKIDSVDQDSIDQLNRDIANFNNTKNSVLEKIREFKTLKDAIQTNDASLNEKIQNITNRISGFETTATEKLSEINNKIQEFNNQKQDSDSKISAIDTKITDIDSKISSVTSLIERTNNTIDTKLQELDTKKQEIENKLREITQKVDSVDQNAIDTLNTAIAEYNRDKESINEKIREFKTLKDAIQTNDTSLNEKIQNITNKISGFETTATEKLRELNTAIETFNRNKDDINTKITTLDPKITDVNAKIDSFLSTYNGDFTTKYNKVVELNNSITSSISDVSNKIDTFNNAYQTKINEINEKYTDFNNKLEDFKRAKTQLESNKGDFDIKYSAFNTAKEQFDGALSKFNRDKQTFQSTIDNVNSSIANFNSNYSTFSSNYNDFITKYNEIKNHRESNQTLPDDVVRKNGDGRINNVATPTENNDATNKKYVDDKHNEALRKIEEIKQLTLRDKELTTTRTSSPITLENNTISHHIGRKDINDKSDAMINLNNASPTLTSNHANNGFSIYNYSLNSSEFSTLDSLSLNEVNNLKYVQAGEINKRKNINTVSDFITSKLTKNTTTSNATKIILQTNPQNSNIPKNYWTGFKGGEYNLDVKLVYDLINSQYRLNKSESHFRLGVQNIDNPENTPTPLPKLSYASIINTNNMEDRSFNENGSVTPSNLSVASYRTTDFEAREDNQHYYYAGQEEIENVEPEEQDFELEQYYGGNFISETQNNQVLNNIFKVDRDSNNPMKYSLNDLINFKFFQFTATNTNQSQFENYNLKLERIEKDNQNQIIIKNFDPNNQFASETPYTQTFSLAPNSNNNYRGGSYSTSIKLVFNKGSDNKYTLDFNNSVFVFNKTTSQSANLDLFGIIRNDYKEFHTQSFDTNATLMYKFNDMHSNSFSRYNYQDSSLLRNAVYKIKGESISNNDDWIESMMRIFTYNITTEKDINKINHITLSYLEKNDQKPTSPSTAMVNADFKIRRYKENNNIIISTIENDNIYNTNNGTYQLDLKITLKYNESDQRYRFNASESKFNVIKSNQTSNQTLQDLTVFSFNYGLLEPIFETSPWNTSRRIKTKIWDINRNLNQSDPSIKTERELQENLTIFKDNQYETFLLPLFNKEFDESEIKNFVEFEIMVNENNVLEPKSRSEYENRTKFLDLEMFKENNRYILKTKEIDDKNIVSWNRYKLGRTKYYGTYEFDIKLVFTKNTNNKFVIDKLNSNFTYKIKPNNDRSLVSSSLNNSYFSIKSNIDFNGNYRPQYPR